MPRQRVGPVRTARKALSISLSKLGKKSKQKAVEATSLVVPVAKEAASSISTQDIVVAGPVPEIDSPTVDESRVRKDREAVKAGNARVYSRDVEAEEGIRLLRILPGAPEDSIAAALEYHDLASPPIYDALSYCWGAQQNLESISVDGKDGFMVSKHLYHAMRRLRRTDRPRLIWIDVICVNQTNIPERNRSVQLMWKIYANAARVIVWVGEVESEKATCRRLFGPKSQQDSQLVWCTQPGLAALGHDHVKRKLDDKLRELERQSYTNGGDVWWKRLWVIQEFTQAREHPTVYLGPHAISWDFFASLMQTENHDRLPLFKHLRLQGNQSLLQLLTMAREFFCSDPRDRVYALLGLIEGGQTFIQPDYGAPVATVYEDATFYLLQTEGHLDLLLDDRLGRNGTDYPTWVPLFTMLRGRHLVRSKDEYDAGPGKPQISLVAAPSDCARCNCATGRALSMGGLFFGKIARRAREATLPGKNTLHRRGANDQIEKPELTRDLQTMEQVFAEMEVDFSKPSKESLNGLDRSTDLGYLMIDYMFGGARSAVDQFEQADHIHLREDNKSNILQEAAKLASKHNFELTEACKLNLLITAVWENAFLTLRHDGLYTPDEDARRLLNCEQQVYQATPAELRERDFFITEDGFIGMGPATLEVGDEIIVPFGASRPFILRKHGDHYALIGDAVVPGIMNGQLMNLHGEGGVQAQEYLLK
jgi:hypothetical protein